MRLMDSCNAICSCVSLSILIFPCHLQQGWRGWRGQSWLQISKKNLRQVGSASRPNQTSVCLHGLWMTCPEATRCSHHLPMWSVTTHATWKAPQTSADCVMWCNVSLFVQTLCTASHTSWRRLSWTGKQSATNPSVRVSFQNLTFSCNIFKFVAAFICHTI